MSEPFSRSWLRTAFSCRWATSTGCKRARAASGTASSETAKIVRAVKLIQGAAKEPRQFLISRDATPPDTDGASIPVWIQDGWSAAEKQIADAARAAGATSPILYVFIPRQSAEDLRRLIVEAEAAQQTLAAKGVPTG